VTGGYYPDTKITDLQGDYLAINTDGSINVAGTVANGNTTKINDGTDTMLVNADGSLTVVANVGTGTQPVSGTVTANAGTGNFLNKPYTPSSADILCGGATVTASTTATTLITIPANRTWYGNLGITLLDTTSPGTGAFRTGVITTTGADTIPAAGTILCKATVHLGDITSPYLFCSVPFIWIFTGASGATVTVTNSSAAAALTSNAYANGVLL
jgi:hypothetical protein